MELLPTDLLQFWQTRNLECKKTDLTNSIVSSFVGKPISIKKESYVRHLAVKLSSPKVIKTTLVNTRNGLMLKLIMLLRVNTTDRLKKLREEMIMSNLDAYIVPLGNILMTGDRMYSYFFQFIRSFSELSFIS